MTDNKNIYHFEGFVLNPNRRELRHAETVVDIEPRAFDVLVYLVNNRDRAVDKGELQDAIWPGMFVTETALTRAVMKARKAIGDDASRQKMIKTLHGHGYRFIARLSLEGPGGSTDSVAVLPAIPVESEVTAQAVKTKLNWRTFVLISFAVILIGGLAWVVLRPELNTGEDIRIAVLPLQDNTENPELAWSSFGLMSYASKLLTSDGSMLVVPVGSIIGLAENFGWSGDLSDPANEKLLGKLKQVYGATHILAMELEPEGTALRMNYNLLTPGGEYQAGTMVGDGGTDLTQGVVQAVYGSMFRKSHLAGEIPLVSKDSFNNEAFARGMDLVVQGRCAEAVKFFRVIIEQEPSLIAPRYELAACLRILGEHEEAESILTLIIDELSPMGSSTQLAETMMTLGILYNRTGRLDQSETIYKEALTLSEELGEDVLRARILQNLSIVYRSRSEYDEASRLLDLALLAYQHAGLEILPGHLYSGRANLSMSRGELVEADAELEKALSAFREVGDRRNEAMMLNNTGYLRRLQGRIEEAEAYSLRSLEIREEIGDRVGVGRIYGMLSGVYLEQGLYDQAISAAQAAGEIARETNDPLFEATSLSQLAEAENAIGEVDSARAHYLEGRDIFVDIQDKLRTLQTDLAIAKIDLAGGQLNEVEQLARQILETSREDDIMSTEVEALELLGDLERDRNQNIASIAQYSNALAILQSSSWASKENTIKIKLANAYMDESDLGSVAPLIGSLAAGPANVQSLKTQARFAFLRGEPPRAVSLMSEAKTLAGENWSEASEASLREYQASEAP
jgi:DNA-binding winged helix-turn-helix (wHTH) protein/tetratricopeptide (TPR) repeat protein